MKRSIKILGLFQTLGKSLMLPIAILPIAGILLRLGQDDIITHLTWIAPIENMKWIAAAGDSIFSHLPLLFAIGVAIGIAKDNAGAAGLAGSVSYIIIDAVTKSINKEINMGVMAGIIAGIIAGICYNKFKDIKLPDFLGFFGGKRFVPIVSGLIALVLAGLFGVIWPGIQHGIKFLGEALINGGAIGGFIFGSLNRILLAFGLHQVLNTLVWFNLGEWTNAAGEIVTGDLNRFWAGDPNAGISMAGFFPIMMFGLPAAALAFYLTAKKERKAEILGLLVSTSFTAVVTGVTEPLEYSFMFIAPFLYLVHAILTGVSLALAHIVHYQSGFTFSAGFIDLVLSWSKSEGAWKILLLGPIFGVAYFLIFYSAIKIFNLKTLGREDKPIKSLTTEPENTENAKKSTLKGKDYRALGMQYISLLGGEDNFIDIDSCVTRLRLNLKDTSIVDQAELKILGTMGVITPGKRKLKGIIGTEAQFIADEIKHILKYQN